MARRRRHNPYATPAADLGQSPPEDESFRAQVDREQRLWLGVVGAILGAFVAIALWVWVTLVFGTAWLVMPLVGVIIGTFVRWLGRGTEPKFGLLAVAATLVAAMACIGLGGTGGFGLVMLFPALALAFILAFRRLGFDGERRYYRRVNKPRVNKSRDASPASARDPSPTAPPVSRHSRRRSRRR